MHLTTLRKKQLEGLNVLYAEGKILGLSGSRTNNNNFLSFRKTWSAVRIG